MKRKRAVLAAIMAAVLVAGCAGSGGTSTFKADKSSIFVTQAGTLSSATTETYENQDYYDEAEWRKSLEDAAAEYNSQHGDGAVKLNSCSLKDGKASMAFDYASGSDLVQFAADYEDTANQLESIQVVTAEAAGSQGLLDDAGFVKASDGKKASKEDILKKGDAQVVIITGQNPVVIQAEGKLLFASEGTSFQDSYTAQTAAGTAILVFK